MLKFARLNLFLSIPFFVALSWIGLSGCDNWTPVIPKVHVINMERNPERLEKIDKEFSREGLGYERFEAVDGSQFDILELERDGTYKYMPNASKYHVKRLSKGEFGNYFSHLGALKKVIKDNSLAIIVEDDIILVSGFMDKLQETIYMAPANWDVIFLGTYSLQNNPLSNSLQNNPLSNRSAGLELVNARRHTGTYGYLVSPAGAKKLVKNMLPVVLPTDLKWQLDFIEQKHGPFNAYCLNPPIILHDDEQQSVIHNMGRDH